MALNIIEVLSDGKYRLFEDNLKQVLSKAVDCDKFAIISIIGCRHNGKSFFMNSIADYLICEDKNSWPQNRVIDPNNGFNSDVTEKDKKIVNMFSEPLIMESNGEKTAVILMDTNNIFDKCYFESDNQYLRTVVDIFLNTSSTIIFLETYKLLVY